jgi:hypothetical protein
MEYYIIYHTGNKKELSLVQTFSYEAKDFPLASRRSFEFESDAAEYAQELAKENNIKYVGPTFTDGEIDEHNYLD